MQSQITLVNMNNFLELKNKVDDQIGELKFLVVDGILCVSYDDGVTESDGGD